MSQVASALPTPLTPRRTDLRRVGPLVGLVVALHALLLALPRQPAVMADALAPTRASVQVRVLEVAPKSVVLATANAATGEVPSSHVEAPVSTSHAMEASAELTKRAPPAAEPAPPANAWLGLALPVAATDDDLYFPRALLSLLPAAIDPIVIDYPRFDGDAGRYVAELSLFIDETGRVARLRVDSGSLPPALEEAARRAFLQARFRPGETTEHGAVKSRIRIEVSFESGQQPPSGG